MELEKILAKNKKSNLEDKIRRGCIPNQTLSLGMRSLPVGQLHIQYMQDRIVIGKFMGISPIEKALIWWIKEKLKPKGQVDLKLGSKGFFIVVFTIIEDWGRVFKKFPYFFNYAGLYLRFQKENFFPKKQDPLVSLVCIRIDSLLHE